MRRSFFLIATIVLLAVSACFTACQYKDLCYDHHHDHNLALKLELKLDLDVDLDVTDEAHTKIHEPEIMVVCFFDTLSGSLKDIEYVGPYGGELQVNPGTYDMVIYAFDTEWTQVRGEGNINTLEAFTSDITSTKSPLYAPTEEGEDSTIVPEPIIYTPDHLLMTRKRVVIPALSVEQPVITVTAKAASIVKTYGFELSNVRGIEYVSKVEAFITNQAKSSFFGIGELNPEAASIYFPMEVNREDMTLKTTFNTFGKLPGESKSYLYIELIDTQGKPYIHITDITEQFEDTTSTIVINDSIFIPQPQEGGGIDPSVEDWDEIDEDVSIG